MHEPDVPLCIDLDGTLVRTDVLVEAALGLLRRNPFYVFAFVGWILRGRAHLKHQIARRSDLEVSALPYDRRVLDWLRGERRPHVLCSASDLRFASAVAAHVGGFDEIIASDGLHNLKGHAKAAALCDRFGERGFDYAGDAHADLAVWRRARRAILVSASAATERAAQRGGNVVHTFARVGGGASAWLRALRLHQWLKSLLIFLPLLAAHRAFDLAALSNAALGFLAFGFCASGVYVLNDLLDLDADRLHPRKRRRPFAAGELPLAQGLAAAPLLTLAGFAIALWLSSAFAAVLLGYYVLTLAYSLRLKRLVMLDVVTLAALYTVRIVAGGVATATPLSFWLLAFSMFLFLSLALLKRYTELVTVLGEGGERASGRGYGVSDLPLLQSFGGVAGYLAVLVFALYINSAASEALYGRPLLLWLLCPLLLYWIRRAWVLAHHGDMHDDPVVFAATDRVSLGIAALSTAIVIGAI